MKKYVLIIVMALELVSCSRKNITIVRGTIKNVHSDYIYLDELKSGSSTPFDSCKIRHNGKFRFKIYQKVPEYYDIRLNGGKTLSLILSPGERVEIDADYRNFYATMTIQGSKNSERLNILHDSLRNTIKKLDNIQHEYTALKDLDTPEIAHKRDSLVQLYKSVKEKHHKYSVSFILENLASLADIGALYQKYDKENYVFNDVRDIQFFKLVSDTLKKYYPKVAMVKLLSNNYQEIQNSYEKQRILQMASGSKQVSIPDLDLPDRHGKLLKLSSIKDKMILVAFWSVNQQQSIVNLQGLKDVYKKYHRKGLEIYQVSVDKSMEQWKNRLKFEEITWPSVCDTAFPNSPTRSLFNVDTLPLNYLIDPRHQKIVAKNFSPVELEKKLSTLLK